MKATSSICKESGYRVETVVSDYGERHPLVVDVTTGLPLFAPSVWLTSHRRVTGVAGGTLANNAVTVAAIYDWANVRGIDLDGRFGNGKFLSHAEMSDLVACLRIVTRSQQRDPHKNVFPFRPGEPMREPRMLDVVTSRVGNYRLDVAADYLHWLATVACNWMANSGRRDESAAAQTVRDDMVKNILGHRERAKGRNAFLLPMAPEPEVIERILNLIGVDHPDNPWADPPDLVQAWTAAENAGDQKEVKRIRDRLLGRLAIRVRNRLIVNLLYCLGIRRGELLGLKARDLKGAKVFVLRRPDDPEDPRKYEPNTKTRDRDLPVNSGLQAMWLDYVSLVRGKFPMARKHPLLIVNHRDGLPLSFSGLAKIFKDLRAVAGVPKNLSPHKLRHAWNDEFSRLADEHGLDEAREVQHRAELMGWNPNSPRSTAAIYLRRHTKRKAQKFLLEMQEDMMHPRGDDHE
ncbi:tyrosine-type recombinase/integrase [Mesoterricola silvestris]|uniref:Recombinase n=1 Tax=Mesoterricola silvestris TaxID=2927979 RepID=A0AA48K7A2_9BACT|nr:tyrosine-type recombinase/integrase [Mesoterricola silvestris]BDU70866.1 recombinase [Mesoterricola silvestris]